MKRMVTCAALVVALVLAATAVAATKHYQGTIKEDSRGSVSFTGVKKHRKIVKVKNFVFGFAPAECDDGTHFFNNGGLPIGPMKVRHRHFHGSIHVSTGGDVKARGEFKNHYRKAEGTIKFSGDLASGQNCTGTDHWKAHKTG
jgi:hypothetical protein